MKPIKLVFHIDRLQLRGVPAEQRDTLVAGLRVGLEEALSMVGVAQQWAESGHRERILGQLTASAEPAVFGRDVAQHIVDRSVR